MSFAITCRSAVAGAMAIFVPNAVKASAPDIAAFKADVARLVAEIF